MSQKILMVPELQWRAGELSLRQCARCGRHRAHVRLVPQVGRVPLGGPAELLERGERIWLAVLEYCSWSGQTRSEPDRQYPHVPAILGRGDHRAVYRVSAPVDLIPEALERLMWPRRAAVARVRDVVEGVRATYLVVPGDYEDFSRDEFEPEAACPACRVAIASEAEAVAVQGRLRVLDAEALPGFERFERYAGQYTKRFFNHSFSAPLVARGRFAALTAEATVEVRSPDHDPVKIPPGRWWLYHPWPAPARGVD